MRPKSSLARRMINAALVYILMNAAGCKPTPAADRATRQSTTATPTPTRGGPLDGTYSVVAQTCGNIDLFAILQRASANATLTISNAFGESKVRNASGCESTTAMTFVYPTSQSLGLTLGQGRCSATCAPSECVPSGGEPGRTIVSSYSLSGSTLTLSRVLTLDDLRPGTISAVANCRSGDLMTQTLRAATPIGAQNLPTITPAGTVSPGTQSPGNDIQGPMVFGDISYINRSKSPIASLTFRSSELVGDGYLFGINTCIAQGAPSDLERNVDIGLFMFPHSSLGTQSSYRAAGANCLGWAANLVALAPGAYSLVLAIRHKEKCMQFFSSSTMCDLFFVRSAENFDSRFDSTKTLSLTITN